MKMWPIIKKEYRGIVKKKSFVISTILTPVLMAAFLFLPVLLIKLGRKEKTFEIIDYSKIAQHEFMKKNETLSDALKLKLKFIPAEESSLTREQYLLVKLYESEISRNPDSTFQLIPQYKEKILTKKIDGLIIIPENIKENRMVYLCAQNTSDFETNQYISSTMQQIMSEFVLKEQNIPLDIVKDATRNVQLGTYKVKKEGTAKTSSGMEYMISIFMFTILFTIILGYGQLLMRGIVEEKSSRIIEVLISSTTAGTIFYGKIIGMGLAGLTQVLAWIAMAAIFVKQGLLAIDPSILNFFTLEMAVYFVIYFIIGYFMYSVMFSIVGAAVNTDLEAQQFAAPIMYLLLIPFFVGMMVTQNPNTPWVIISSLIPLFSPTLMFMRITVSVPPLAQLLASIFMSVVFTVFLAWFGAKIFRVGILMYGKKPTFKEMIRWSRHS